LNNIANDSINTNVGFVGLLEHHDKPHMSRWVRDVNMVLEHALWIADRSQIGLIEVSSINRYDHTRHGLYLNSRGKEKLVHLITDSIRCGPEIGRIPVISGVISRPFLD
jgi:hypothetical protein